MYRPRRNSESPPPHHVLNWCTFPLHFMPVPFLGTPDGTGVFSAIRHRQGPVLKLGSPPFRRETRAGQFGLRSHEFIDRHTGELQCRFCLPVARGSPAASTIRFLSSVPLLRRRPRAACRSSRPLGRTGRTCRPRRSGTPGAKRVPQNEVSSTSTSQAGAPSTVRRPLYFRAWIEFDAHTSGD
jgi:hypothetical protein